MLVFQHFQYTCKCDRLVSTAGSTVPIDEVTLHSVFGWILYKLIKQNYKSLSMLMLIKMTKRLLAENVNGKVVI